MSKIALLEKAKELNIPCRNCIKTKQEFERAFKDTNIKFKEIIFGVDSPTCVKCFEKTSEAASNR